MFLASKATLAGIIILLTTGISKPRPMPVVSGPSLSNEGPAVGHWNDVERPAGNSAGQRTLSQKGRWASSVSELPPEA